uniref:glycosyltransferase n=1 Tax=Phenylobacterium sp. TaxID=1871053 RepID=UPI0035B29C79
MQRERRLFVVDPSLRDLVGHHFEYDAATLEGARALGVEAVVLGHRNADAEIAQALGVRPVFGFDIWGAPPGADDPVAAANAAFAQDLLAALPPHALGPDDTVFGHMITDRQLAGWADYAAGLRRNGPQLVLLLRYEAFRYEHPLALQAFARLSRLKRRGVRLRFASDSARLAHALGKLAGEPVEVLPIPHTTHLRPARAAPAQGRPLRVVSLGNARDEKGLLELFDAVRLQALRGDAADFAYVLQVNNATAALQPAIDRFAAERHPNVALLSAPLDSADYYRLLSGADIVALPYWRDVYEARTSGVLLEAAGAGRPVVCTAGTWMSDQLATTGGGVVCDDRSPQGLAAALAQLRADFDHYAQAAFAAAEPWLRTHNPQSFAERLLGLAEPLAGAAPLRVAMFYPWGDAPRRASGASQRLNSVADFLVRRVEQVQVLQDNVEAPARDGRIAYSSLEVLGRAERRIRGRILARLLRALGARDGEDVFLRLHLAAWFDRELARRVEAEVRASDAVFLEYAFWAPVVARAIRRWPRPWILTAHDVLADQVKASGPVIRWLTACAERYAMGFAPRLATLSEADAVRLRRGGLPAQAIPLALDTAAVAPLPGAVRPLLDHLCGLPKDAGRLVVFVGSAYGPNRSAAEALRGVTAALRRQQPDLAFTVVVAGACAEPERGDRWVALGPVDTLTLHLLHQCAALVVAPMTVGTGASVKSAEALGRGTPVLATALGARGLDAEALAGVRVEDDLAAWPAVLAHLLQGEAGAAALAELRRGAEASRRSLDLEHRLADYLTVLPAAPARRTDAAAPAAWRDLVLAAAARASDAGLARL